MFGSDDGERSIPISALEHYAYCPRQAVLIHAESYFASNVDTIRGDIAHAAVDRIGGGQDRNRQRIWRSLPVWHTTIGMHGICDVVQFSGDEPVPIEHKSGRYQPGGPADLQVAAQALCLRVMFHAPVPVGVIFAGRDRRRYEVRVDDLMAEKVATAVAAVRELFDTGTLPSRAHHAKCRRCSLRSGCIPELPQQVVSRLFQPREVGDWVD